MQEDLYLFLRIFEFRVEAARPLFRRQEARLLRLQSFVLFLQLGCANL